MKTYIVTNSRNHAIEVEPEFATTTRFLDDTHASIDHFGVRLHDTVSAFEFATAAVFHEDDVRKIVNIGMTVEGAEAQVIDRYNSDPPEAWM